MSEKRKTRNRNFSEIFVILKSKFGQIFSIFDFDNFSFGAKKVLFSWRSEGLKVKTRVVNGELIYILQCTSSSNGLVFVTAETCSFTYPWTCTIVHARTMTYKCLLGWSDF